MTSYQRPLIDAPVFRGIDGEVIDYGNRWEGSPPEDTYSVDTHPERFAPLHTVALALIDHLGDTYDVALVEGDDAVADLLHPASDVIRAVRIQPTDPACAAVTIVFTKYPGIFMHAGLLHDFHYPVCGCDACDSTWDAEADALEQQLLAVASGNYSERIDRGPRPWIEHKFTYPGQGWQGGRGRARDISAERVKRAKPVLRNLPGGVWAAWPKANSDSDHGREVWR
ncbi:DUF6226 family protein [Microbacterium thalassium]|uniref:Uncharacterized protein n=1 Tax=Microbacterium thalassium TaxID=362649 RepID=A0A7X0FME9_9MICO|nr:DUF6226 family protein [Microbacterium thalassium]MBB6390208.1 hypothetical protein [Microbacterium thalassium]